MGLGKERTSLRGERMRFDGLLCDNGSGIFFFQINNNFELPGDRLIGRGTLTVQVCELFSMALY